MTDKVVIDKTLAEELKTVVENLLCSWDPYNSGNDYVCHFCKQRSHSSVDIAIRHSSSCNGTRLLLELDKAIKP